MVKQVDRQAFLAERKKAIGASDLAAVLGMSKWKTPWEVWADKTGRLAETPDNPAMSAGRRLESAVLDHAENELGALVRDVRVAFAGLPLVATCDAVTDDTGRPVEAKTTGIVGPIYGSWGDALTDEVPQEYLVQVHAQLMCTGAELGYLFALIPGRGVVEFNICRNERLNEYLGNVISDWWERHVSQGIEPPVEPMPSVEVLKRLKREPSKTIEASEAFVTQLRHYEEAKQLAKAAQDTVKSCEADLLHWMQDAEIVSLPDGREFTCLETERKGYTVRPTKYRSVRIRKSKANK